MAETAGALKPLTISLCIPCNFDVREYGKAAGRKKDGSGAGLGGLCHMMLKGGFQFVKVLAVAGSRS